MDMSFSRRAAIDPTVLERERADIAAHQRKVQLLDRLDSARSKLAAVQADDTRRKVILIRAIERVDSLTARAVALGLIREHRKETAK